GDGCSPAGARAEKAEESVPAFPPPMTAPEIEGRNGSRRIGVVAIERYTDDETQPDIVAGGGVPADNGVRPRCPVAAATRTGFEVEQRDAVPLPGAVVGQPQRHCRSAFVDELETVHVEPQVKRRKAVDGAVARERLSVDRGGKGNLDGDVTRAAGEPEAEHARAASQRCTGVTHPG